MHTQTQRLGIIKGFRGKTWISLEGEMDFMDGREGGGAAGGRGRNYRVEENMSGDSLN